MGERQEPVSFVSEQQITAAMLRLISPEERVVYFLTGHGEYSPEDSGDQAYTQVKRTLESKNYTVNLLNLLSANSIPADADVLVVAGPRKPVSSAEVDLIKQFAENGGALVAMLEPLPMTDFGDDPDPLAEYLKQTWGISLGADIVVDPTSTQPFAPYAARYGSHEITRKMQQITSQFPTVRSVTAVESEIGANPVDLVYTADQSWGETNLVGLENNEIVFDAAVDAPGPISLAVAAQDLQNDGRVVVFGDADFVIDANYYAYANGDLFINSIDWAAGNEDMISLTPKQNTQRLLTPPDRLTTSLLLLGTVVLLPGLALVWGLVVWLQRRRRG